MKNSTKVLLGVVLILGLPLAPIHAGGGPADRRPTETVPSPEERLQSRIKHGTAAERESARVSLEELRKQPPTKSNAVGEKPAYAAVHFLTAEANEIDYWPCFSPDGSKLLFSRSKDGGDTWDLLFVPATGGGAHRLSSSPLPVSATRPSWSRQQNVIAFTGTSSNRRNTVWLVNADGTQPRQLAPAGLSEHVLYPSWYPDGRIAVTDKEVIKRIDSDHRTAVVLTDHKQVLTGMPSVSPDGKWIAFAGQENIGRLYAQTKNSIWLLSNTGALRPLESALRQGQAPAWSPDGARLAFESNRDSPTRQHAVYVIDRDGTGLRQVTPLELDAYCPVWSPDGRRLAFAALHTKGSNATGIAVVDISRP
jgi:Tol biopolymer transport system component